MRPDDLIGRMMVDEQSVILFDRRSDVHLHARAIGYELQDAADAVSPIDSAKVTVALLRPAAGDLGEEAVTASHSRRGPAAFIRLMDRFYVPAAGDPVISALFFELIAERYEELTATDVNRRTAKRLLDLALHDRPDGEPWKILDFGCGTGYALSALKALGPKGKGVELLGTDLSEAMLSIARQHGELVSSLSDWRAMPSETFDAAISCFVLHYGVPSDDLAHIARQLRPGGVFSANLFKGDDERLAHLIEEMEIVGLRLSSSEQSAITATTPNRHLVFRKCGGPAS